MRTTGDQSDAPVSGAGSTSRTEGVRASIVVVAYDIARELPRTLRSLSVGYQEGVDAADYEVVVVDNGSPMPIDASIFDDLDGQFRLVRIDDAPPSPAHAVNVGLREARGATIGVLVDGARLASPGLVGLALAGSQMYERTLIVTLGWYLGYDFQRQALEAGWTQADEDRLLASIDWPADGYRLFDIATMDESSVSAWLYWTFESNAIFLPASAWEELGGYDERFDAPGGGLVNHDTLRRATELEGIRTVTLLSEATFHQLHGGVATNIDPGSIEQKMVEWTAQYESLRGRSLEALKLEPTFLGTLPVPVQPRIAHTLNRSLEGLGVLDVPVAASVRMPDPDGQSDPMAAEWMRMAVTSARCGADVEAMLFARLARNAAPDTFDAGPLLACVASMGSLEDLPPLRRAQFHADAGQACERGGAPEDAEAHYRKALGFEPGNNDAYLGLTRVRLPGPDYHRVLRWVHEAFAPPTYLEIGVCEGESLALVRPGTVAIGVDPVPDIRHPMVAQVHLYQETSDDFFANHGVRELFGDRSPSMVFIDGLHEFPAALADFANVEAIADEDTLVVLHDMLPFDEITQRAERVHNFYTGDVWKMLHCLAEERPSLSWFTVRTPPSGLTFVTGLDPTSTHLRDNHDKLVERYGALEFSAARTVPGPVIDNERALIRDRLALWRTPSQSAEAALAAAGEAGGVAGADGLSRRIEALESLDGSGRTAIADLKRELIDTRMTLDHARFELDAIRSTRMYRSTRVVRKVYAKVRGRGEVA